MDYAAVWDDAHRLHVAVYQVQNGPVCPYLKLDGRIAKQVAAYHSIHQDLYECNAIIQYQLDNVELPFIVKTSLYNAFIIQYARCFTSSERRKVTLNQRDVFKGEDEQFLKSHKYMMDIRNHFLAHASEHEFEANGMIAYLSPDQSDRGIVQTVYCSNKLYDHTGRKEDYKKLMFYMLSYIEKKIFDLDDLYGKELDELSIEELYSKCKVPQEKDAVMANGMTYKDNVNPNL